MNGLRYGSSNLPPEFFRGEVGADLWRNSDVEDLTHVPKDDAEWARLAELSEQLVAKARAAWEAETSTAPGATGAIAVAVGASGSAAGSKQAPAECSASAPWATSGKSTLPTAASPALGS